MHRIDELKLMLKNNPKKKIILTETDDRVLKAAVNVLEEDLVDLVIIGDKDKVIEKYSILEKAEWINFQNIDNYAYKLYELRKDKITLDEASTLLKNNYMYLACLLLLEKRADGIVSGATHTTADTLRPALQIIKGKEELVSSFFLMETSDKDYIFADCGLIQEPSAQELAIIAQQSIKSYEQLIGDNPKLAFLSFSTYGSSTHKSVDKVIEATKLAKENNPNYLIDGELQLDSAIIPAIASIKCPNSPLKGEANILIFPDLNSGNIGYKLVERFGHAKAYGPLMQGLNYPVNDLSRGSSIEDIIGVIIITALQAS